MFLIFSSMSLLARTASNHFLYDDKRLWLTSVGIFPHSLVPTFPNSFRFEGRLSPDFTFNYFQRFSIGFKSGDWIDHSRTLMRLVLNLRYAQDHYLSETSNVFLIRLFWQSCKDICPIYLSTSESSSFFLLHRVLQTQKNSLIP